MKTLLINLFGAYNPVTYTNSEGLDVVADGLAGVDWPYVLGIVLFAIVLYSALRLLGVIIKQ